MNEFGILVAADNQNNTILEIAYEGRLTSNAVFQILGKKIRKQRVQRAVFVTDKHQSYIQFVEQKNLFIKWLMLKIRNL